MTMRVQLKTKNKGTLTLKNPIMAASGTFGSGLEYSPFGDLTTLGGIFVKGLSLEKRKGNAMPRIAETASGMLNAVGLQNDGVEAFVNKVLPRLPWSEVPIFANLYGASLEEFSGLAEILGKQEGIAGLEVNISCPNVKEGGVIFGQDPKAAAAVTQAVVAKANGKPVIVKLSPNVTSIKEIALAVEEAGADCISCINTLTGMSVDIHSRRPRLSNVIGGLSGPAIKPVALRCVWEVSNAVSIPVIGIGGITCAADVLEFILVGAHAVQVGTANFFNPGAIFTLADDVARLMGKMGIKNLAEYRGSLVV